MADDLQREPLDLAWVLCVATAGAVPFLRGGVDEPTAFAAAMLAVVAFVLEHRRKPGGFSAQLPRALWPLVAACVWQTLLLVPWKVSAASLRAFVWQALADPPSWAPTALNPGALAIDLVRLWTVLLFAMTIAHRTGRGRTNMGLYWALTVSGTAQIACSAFFPSAGFVNPNHRAAFFTLTSICAASVALMSRRQGSRGLALIVSGVAIGATIFTLSRAGIAAAVLGLAVFTALLRPRRGRRALGPLLIVAFAAVIAGYVMIGPLGARFKGRTEEKTRVWAQALAVVKQYPIGTGRTGFGLAFESVRTPDKEGGRWDYVENTYLQALTDYGPVGGGVAIVCWLWLLVRVVQYARKRPPGGLRSPRRAAVAGIVVALSAHAVFDFNWEMLGIALPVWMLIAALGRPGEQPFQASAFSKRGPRAGWVFAAAVIVIIPSAMYGAQHTPRRLDALVAEPSTRNAALLDLVRTRPLDAWALVALGDDALARKDAKESLRWFNRAVLVAPSWAEPHLSLARLFCAAKLPSQAHVEMKLALERLHAGEHRVFAVLARCIGDGIEDAFPDKGRADLWHEAVVWSIASDAPALTQAIAAVYRGVHSATLQRLASDARRRGDRVAWEKWLAQFANPADPLRLAEIAEDALAKDQPSSAIAALEQALTTDDPVLRLRLVQVLIAKGELARAETEAAPLAEHCAHNRLSNECRGYRLARASIAMQARRPLDALEQYKTILLTAPDDVEVTLLATTALETLGDVKEAIELLKKNERLTSHPAVRQRREALETPR